MAKARLNLASYRGITHKRWILMTLTSLKIIVLTWPWLRQKLIIETVNFMTCLFFLQNSEHCCVCLPVVTNQYLVQKVIYMIQSVGWRRCGCFVMFCSKGFARIHLDCGVTGNLTNLLVNILVDVEFGCVEAMC